MKYYLAIDIGASSGRHIIGYYQDNELITNEVYRFKNGVTEKDDHLTWDIDYLFKEVKAGIKKALEKYPHIESLGIDTWGVDYVLLDKDDHEIMPCFAYRDGRTKDVIAEVHKLIPFEDLYKITGSQFQEFNTIYQLYWDYKNKRLDNATTFLHIPEYLMYKLTGKKVHEYTNASTTGLMDGQTNNYSQEIIEKLGFKKSLFNKLSKPKTLVGDLTVDVQKEVGGNIKVKLVPTHDTASAVEGIPMKENAPYISSGTWSLLGIKTKNIINSNEAMHANYSNEFGPNYIRFQKNIMGLWIIQNLSKQLNMDFPSMVMEAQKSEFREIFDVNNSAFLFTDDMVSEIKNWYFAHNLNAPKNNADIINATYHSLASSYKDALHELEGITGEKYKNLYIVGGGAKNQYLNELTEKYTCLKVIALPIEATAIGNLKSQMED